MRTSLLPAARVNAAELGQGVFPGGRMKQRRGPAGSRRSISPSIRAGLPFLPEGVLPGLGWLPGQRERRQGGAAFLLLVPLRLRLLLFLGTAHLTLGHVVPPGLACSRARAVAGLKRRRRTDSSGVSRPRIPWPLASFAGRRHRHGAPRRLHRLGDYILNIFLDYETCPC